MPATSLTYPDLSGRGQSYEGLTLAVNPTLFLPLQEVNGTNAEDLGSGGNDGTYHDSPTLGARPGPAARVAGISRYVDFNGTNHRVDCPNVVDNGFILQTVSVWLKPGRLQTTWEFVLCTHLAGDAAPAVIFGINGDTSGCMCMAVLCSGDNFISRTGSVLSTGVWQHLMWQWWANDITTTTQVKMHLNGVEQAYGSGVSGSGSPPTAAGSWSVGGRIYDDARNYQGGIAYLSWHPLGSGYSRMHTPKLLYNAGLHGA